MSSSEIHLWVRDDVLQCRTNRVERQKNDQETDTSWSTMACLNSCIQQHLLSFSHRPLPGVFINWMNSAEREEACTSSIIILLTAFFLVWLLLNLIFLFIFGFGFDC
jgi:hypothetical protein